MNYSTILIEQEEAVAVVKINRPQAMNALNQEVLLELLAALEELDQCPLGDADRAVGQLLGFQPTPLNPVVDLARRGAEQIRQGHMRPKIIRKPIGRDNHARNEIR